MHHFSANCSINSNNESFLDAIVPFLDSFGDFLATFWLKFVNFVFILCRLYPKVSITIPLMKLIVQI